MGHQRLGILAATKPWDKIVALIVSGEGSVAELADQVLDSCDKSFSRASKDPAFREAIYLLCKIPLAAKSENLSTALAEIGINVPDNPSRTDIIVGFERAIEKAQRSDLKNVTDLSEMAKQAGISALNSLLGKPFSPPQLEMWGPSKEGVHLTLSQCATPDGFCDLAQSFFANFGNNNIRYFIDRELPRHLGQDGFAKSIPDMTLFDQSVQRHNNEASVIMRFFAKEWYAKAQYQDKKKLTIKDATGFAHVAIEKMRKEYRIRNARK